MMRAFVLDDEPLAVKRLCRMLAETGRVAVAGTSTDPVDALAALARNPPGVLFDVLFLDIQMPGMNGFEMLAKLDSQPIVIFTTAYDQYALQAFQVNSIDYLLKPVEAPQLLRALDKIERLRGVPSPPPEWKSVLAQLAGAMRQPAGQAYPERIASRLGERIQLLEVARITHFFARDKLTYAATDGKCYVVDLTVAELEEKLDPRQFVRIHRSTLVNIRWVREIDAWFGGKLLVRLKDAKATELQVARDRVAELKQRIGA
jgi:two-component system, LytTR family, response regulator